MCLRRLQFDGDGPEFLPLFVIQHSLDLVHVAGKSGDGEQVPA